MDDPRRRALHYREAIRVFDRLDHPLTTLQLRAVPPGVRGNVAKFQRVAFGPQQTLNIDYRVRVHRVA